MHNIKSLAIVSIFALMVSCGESETYSQQRSSDAETTTSSAHAMVQGPPARREIPVQSDGASGTSAEQSIQLDPGTAHPIELASAVLAWRQALDPARHTGMNTLLSAAAAGDTSTIRRIIDAADRDSGYNRDYPTFQEKFMSRDGAGWNALHLAAYFNRIDSLNALMSVGVLQPDWTTGSMANSHGLNPWDTEPADSADRKLSAVHLAAMEGHIGVLRVFMDSGDHGQPSGFRGPVNAATHDPFDPSRIEANRTPALSSDCDRGDISGLTPLDYAVIFDRTEAMKFLVEHGASLESNGPGDAVPAILAVDANRLDALIWLRERGARMDVQDDQGCTLLHHAAATNDVRTATWLLDVGGLKRDAVTNNGGLTPLHMSARFGARGVAMLLLDRGCQADDWDARQATPLFYAAAVGDTSMISLLLSRGAAVDATEMSGLTPLFAAAMSDSKDAVMALLAAHASPGKTNNVGQSPVHFAAEANAMHAAEAIVAAGASINAADQFGNTPLHMAAQSKAIDFTQFALEHGANINAVNALHQTPLDLAAQIEGAEDVVRLLRARGAKLGRDL